MKLLVKRLFSYYPTLLPVGMTAFQEWSDSIIELAGNYADADSMRFAIANNLIHLSHTTSRKPKAYFVNTLRKAAANQVASQVFQDVKERQQKAASEAAKLQQAEVTAAETLMSEGSSKAN